MPHTTFFARHEAEEEVGAGFVVSGGEESG